MTTFTIRPDDAGVQSLKRKNSRPTTAKAVNQISAITATHTGQMAPVDDQAEAFLPVYIGRRKQQRRKNNEETAFDTRANEERRASGGSDIDAEDELLTDSEGNTHIDVNA